MKWEWRKKLGISRGWGWVKQGMHRCERSRIRLTLVEQARISAQAQKIVVLANNRWDHKILLHLRNRQAPIRKDLCLLGWRKNKYKNLRKTFFDIIKMKARKKLKKFIKVGCQLLGELKLSHKYLSNPFKKERKS